MAPRQRIDDAGSADAFPLPQTETPDDGRIGWGV